MMRRIIPAFILILFCFVFSHAQSGRKVTPSPTPTAEDPETFSESRPQTKRPPRIIPSMRSTAVKTETAPSADSAKSATPVEELDEPIIKVDTTLVTIPVSVFDRNGLYIPNIRQSEFKIFEDGVEQEIAYFGTTEKPFTVVLLLDTSNSTQYRIEDIRGGAKAFVEQLKPQDRVMVIEFARKVKVRTELTNDRQEIFKGIDKAEFGGGTSIYDAVGQTLQKHLSKVEGRKAIVLFTDGVDTTSDKASYDSTLDFAEESDAIIFPIYFNTFGENRQSSTSTHWPPSTWPIPSSVPSGIGVSASEYALGKKYVEELADYTGGRVFRPESTPGGLTRAFEGIAEELRRQYNIGYIPTEDGLPGQRKIIKVRVARPNLVLRARDSYIVDSDRK